MIVVAGFGSVAANSWKNGRADNVRTPGTDVTYSRCMRAFAMLLATVRRTHSGLDIAIVIVATLSSKAWPLQASEVAFTANVEFDVPRRSDRARSPAIGSRGATKGKGALSHALWCCRRAKCARDGSVVFALDQLGVRVRIEQLIEILGQIVGLDHENPAVAVRILVDRLRLVGQRLVDLDNRAGNRRIDV